MLNSQTEPVLESSSETSLENQKKTKVKLVCHNCGSDNIIADAYARWDIQTQNWNLSSVFDNKICEDCGYEKDYCDRIPIEKESKATEVMMTGTIKPFAYCCAEAGGDPAFCDCVNKNHGTAIFKSVCIIPNCRNRAPADEAFCAQHMDKHS